MSRADYLGKQFFKIAQLTNSSICYKNTFLSPRSSVRIQLTISSHLPSLKRSVTARHKPVASTESQNHRIVGAGRDLCGSPCQSRVTQSRLHRILSRRVLNISREGDSTTSLGSLFQCSRTFILVVTASSEPVILCVRRELFFPCASIFLHLTFHLTF